MTQIVERLELPTETFRALEQVAQVDGSTLSVVVNRLVKEKLTKQLRSLRREYQRLIAKELTYNINREEKARLEVVTQHINAIELQSKAGRNAHRRLDEIDTRLDEIGNRFQELHQILEALPDHRTEAE